MQKSKVSEIILGFVIKEWSEMLLFNSLEYVMLFIVGGTRWRNWLRHCATSRKVAGSIADLVIGIFNWLNSSSPTNRNKYQVYLLVGKGGQCVRLTTLPPSCSECLEIPGALRVCPGLLWNSFIFFYYLSWNFIDLYFVLFNCIESKWQNNINMNVF